MIKAFCKWYLTTFHNVAKFKQKKSFVLQSPITTNGFPANWDVSTESLQNQITELQKENASQKKELLLSKIKKGVTVKVNQAGLSWFGYNAGIKVGRVDDVYTDGDIHVSVGAF